MATNNFKLFDENKLNMLTDQEYLASQQRLGGVQAGIASSMLQNKFAYQMSLVAYAIAQMMNANGLDASDTMAVSAFVANLSSSVLQKVIDKATTAEAQAGTSTAKWMTPALVKSFFDYRIATQAEAQAGTNNTKVMTPLRVAQAMTGTGGSGLTVPVQRGGTGKTSWVANRIPYLSSATAFAQVVFPSVAGSFLRQGTSGGPYWTNPDDVPNATNTLVYVLKSAKNVTAFGFNVELKQKSITSNLTLNGLSTTGARLIMTVDLSMLDADDRLLYLDSWKNSKGYTSINRYGTANTWNYYFIVNGTEYKVGGPYSNFRDEWTNGIANILEIVGRLIKKTDTFAICLEAAGTTSTNSNNGGYVNYPTELHANGDVTVRGAYKVLGG